MLAVQHIQTFEQSVAPSVEQRAPAIHMLIRHYDAWPIQDVEDEVRPAAVHRKNRKAGCHRWLVRGVGTGARAGRCGNEKSRHKRCDMLRLHPAFYVKVALGFVGVPVKFIRQ